VVIACGIESMSRVPMGAARIGQNPYGASMVSRRAGLCRKAWRGAARGEVEELARRWTATRHAPTSALLLLR
jgi:acetyl-CoA acetyltransferase